MLYFLYLSPLLPIPGAIPPTSGEALVYEEAISSTGGLDRIRSQMGVCPQFDILWAELSGAEHLSIYGHIKGLPRNKVGGVTGACDKSLFLFHLLAALPVHISLHQGTAAKQGGRAGGGCVGRAGPPGRESTLCVLMCWWVAGCWSLYQGLDQGTTWGPGEHVQAAAAVGRWRVAYPSPGLDTTGT